MKIRLGFTSIVATVLLASCNTIYAPAAAPDMSAQIAASIANPDRPEGQTKRDVARNPSAILAFSGIKTGDSVADLGAGGGYFSRLLSGLVGPSGQVIVQNPPAWIEKYKGITPGVKQLNEARPNTSGLAAKFDDLGFKSDSLDAATMMLIYHDTALLPVDRAKMNAGIYTALKPGGVLLITDHHATKGTGTDKADSLHRIDSDTVMAEVLAAGFTLKASSDALHFGEDDPEISVFDPSVRGKTNRFVYLFEKP